MPRNWTFFAVLALMFAVFTQMSPVAAEFSASTQELAAQSRPRITIHPRRTHPGPNVKRYCRSWLAKEYRVSGPVIVPQMRCWWE
jgi:hypothetical protein